MYDDPNAPCMDLLIVRSNALLAAAIAMGPNPGHAEDVKKLAKQYEAFINRPVTEDGPPDPAPAIPMASVLITDFGPLSVPDEIAAAVQYANRVAPEAARKWERAQCRSAGEAWAKGETHTITAEGLDDAQSQAA